MTEALKEISLNTEMEKTLENLDKGLDETVFSLDDVSIKYGDFRAVSHVNMEIWLR